MGRLDLCGIIGISGECDACVWKTVGCVVTCPYRFPQHERGKHRLRYGSAQVFFGSFFDPKERTSLHAWRQLHRLHDWYFL
jgi:hypothetical protein